MKIQFVIATEKGEFPFKVDTDHLPGIVGNRYVELKDFKIIESKGAENLASKSSERSTPELDLSGGSMVNSKEIIDRYLNNIELWEKVSDLEEWEKDHVAGQRHACEQILECVEKGEIPTWWPPQP